MYEAVKALALCHNVTPVIDEAETTETNGHIEMVGGEITDIMYQASSPDEVSIYAGVFITIISDGTKQY